MNVYKTLSLAILIMAGHFQAFSFCGFYVSKADAKLFNKASQVILVRDGRQNVVTMSNDFYGDVKDFAMVVPVPVVLERDDIKVVDRYIFDKLDTYTGPRLVEYFDINPCQSYLDYPALKSTSSMSGMSNDMMEPREEEASLLGISIEAAYTIGEYDILLLSANESNGLKTWLNQNGYQVPKDAEEVLEPYIKSDMKFFVVKVNLEKQEQTGFDYLRPIQISYESNRFMLPIRLGMANAEEAQDLIVYAFTKNGRVETVNYRTAKIPTAKNIPTFIKDNFGQFYKDAFDKSYKRNGRNAVFLEYSWDISSTNYVKCDPCTTTPPSYAELKDAGVFWAKPNGNNSWGGADYTGDLFITRLHVKYDREHFPQDLFFQATPNKESFQGRYIMNHPVQGHLDCEEAAGYYQTVLDRRENELDELAYLTGWNVDEYDYYLSTYTKKLNRAKDNRAYKDGAFFNPIPNVDSPDKGFSLIVFSAAALFLLNLYLSRKNILKL